MTDEMVHPNCVSRGNVYGCPHCHVRIATWQSQTDATCPWCNTQLLRSDTTHSDSLPECLMPFTVSREQAVAALHRYAGKTLFAPDAFEAHVERAQAVFVPFWIVNAKAIGSVALLGHIALRRSRTYYAARRAGRKSFADLSVTASTHMSDTHLDSVGPYSIDDPQPFSGDRVGDVATELPSKTALSAADQVKALARESVYRSLLNSTLYSEYNQHSGWFAIGLDETVERHEEARVTRQRLFAMPAWILHCTWEGKDLLFAVNGQNGKCVGNLPLDNLKITIAELFAFFVGLGLVMLMAGMLMLTYLSDPKEQAEALLIPLSVGIGVGVVCAHAARARIMMQTQTAVETSHDDRAQGTHTFVPTIRWDSKPSHTIEEARQQLRDSER